MSSLPETEIDPNSLTIIDNMATAYHLHPVCVQPSLFANTVDFNKLKLNLARSCDNFGKFIFKRSYKPVPD